MRRRYQCGTLIQRGKVERVWVGRWREDELQADGLVRRVKRSEVLGTLKEYPTRRLALRVLQQRVAHVNSKDYRPRASLTFQQFADKWQQSVLVNHKPSWQEVAGSLLRRQILPKLGGLSLKDFSVAGMQTYVTSLPGEPKSKKNIVGLIKTMWKQAKAWGYVAHDPFDGLVLPRVREKEQPCFSGDDMRAIIAAAEGQWKTLFWLAGETGMREGEILGLRPEDVDAEESIVRVRQSVWRGRVQTTKTRRSVRTYLVSATLRQHLCALAKQPVGDHLSSVRFLFGNEGGSPLSHTTVYTELQRVCELAGVKPAGMHAFRHGNSSIMDRWNVPPKLRQQRLGHSDERMMMRYSHVASADEVALVEKLGALFSQQEVAIQ